MLNLVKAYSSWPNAVPLAFDSLGHPETDLFQIRDIEGLGPVTANINTSQLGSMDGDTYVGSAVGARNIVLTVKPNPDWSTWTYEKLRQLQYTYFMPKRMIRLVFETDEFSPVEILGYVESNEPAIFSKDGEIQISIICPYPYFTSVDPVTLTGSSADSAITINYDGTIETGIYVGVYWASGDICWYVSVQVGDPLQTYFGVNARVDSNKYFEMSSVPGQKYVRNVAYSSGVITNLLNKIWGGSSWPVLQPGDNSFEVNSDFGVQNWSLTYYKRYGGL